MSYIIYKTQVFQRDKLTDDLGISYGRLQGSCPFFPMPMFLQAAAMSRIGLHISSPSMFIFIIYDFHQSLSGFFLLQTTLVHWALGEVLEVCLVYHVTSNGSGWI